MESKNTYIIKIEENIPLNKTKYSKRYFGCVDEQMP